MVHAQKIELRSAKIYIRETPPQWDKALAQLETAMEKDPDNNEVHYLLGYIHLVRGNSNLGLNLWESVIFDELGRKEKDEFKRRLSNFVRSNSNAGTQSFGKSEYAEAAVFFENVVKAASIQQTALLSTGKKQDAEQAGILEEAKQTSILNWGYSMYNAGDLDSARKLLEQYIEGDPQNVGVWDSLMRIYYNTEEWEKAVEASNKFIDLSDELDASTFVVLSGAYFSLADTTSVIDTYKRAIEVFPTEYRFYRDISSLYEGKKDYDALIQVLEKGHSALPENVELLSRLGTSYYNKGLSDRDAEDVEAASTAFHGAVDSMDKLLALQPNSIDGHDILSDAYFGLDSIETDEAKKEEFAAKGQEHQRKKLDLIKTGEGM